MVRDQAYGVRSIRVDGNDALAVYTVVQKALEMAITEQRPMLGKQFLFFYSLETANMLRMKQTMIFLVLLILTSRCLVIE